jgi:amino acid transporter
VVADQVGGRGLASLVTLGAVLSTGGLFLAGVLTNSRLPFVLARDGQLPAWLGVVHPRLGTPWAAILVSSLAYSVFALWSFQDLVVLDIWLYSLALLVELAAFVALRWREPELPRPWRVSGGRPGMWLAALPPAALSVAAMVTAGWWDILAGVAAALTGPAAYRLWRARGVTAPAGPRPSPGRPPRD